MEEEGEVRYMDGDDALSSKCSLPCLALHLSQIILSTPVQILVFCLFPASGNSTFATHFHYPRWCGTRRFSADWERQEERESGWREGFAERPRSSCTVSSGVTQHPAESLACNRHGTTDFQMTG